MHSPTATQWNLMILSCIFQVIYTTVPWPPKEAECCKAQASTWRMYNPELNLHGLCDDGYHLPETLHSADAAFAADCLSNKNKHRIQNPSNGYFLVTKTSLINCYQNPSECIKYIMICVKDDCSPDTELPTTQAPSAAPTLYLNCINEPIAYTASMNLADPKSYYLNWQRSFPVKMGIAVKNDPLVAQIKFYSVYPTNASYDPLPTDVIPCDGDTINATNHPLLSYMFNNFDPNYNGVLQPNCDNRVIIRYSDADNIPFGSIGGTDELPPIDVALDEKKWIDNSLYNCPFDHVELRPLDSPPLKQSFDQRQPYLAMNILLATDFVSGTIDNDFQIGELVVYAGSDAVIHENGLVPCDGSIYEVQMFPKLFDIVRDTYFYNGTHFGIPDCSGKALINSETVSISNPYLGESQGTLTKKNIHNLQYETDTIQLTNDDQCRADIRVEYINDDCMDLNNIMPVFPAVFVIDSTTNELKFFIQGADVSRYASSAHHLSGILYGSTQSLTEERGSDSISCAKLPLVEDRRYEVFCEETHPPTEQPTPEPTPKPTPHPNPTIYVTTVNPSIQPTIEPTVEPTIVPSFVPTHEPTAYPTNIPTADPTAIPTFVPTMNPTKDPTTEPTLVTKAPTIYPTLEPTNHPTANPTMRPTASQCDFFPSDSQLYEFAVVVDDSCALTAAQCKHQLQQLAELLWIIKVDLPPLFTRVSFVYYGPGDASVDVSLNDDELQNNIAAFYDHILYDFPCGGDGSGQTDLVDGINITLAEFRDYGNPDTSTTTYRKIFTINNCENNVQNTTTEICDVLYDELDFMFKTPIDRIVINNPYSNSTTIMNDDYLSCFTKPRLGAQTGFVCAKPNWWLSNWDYTQNEECIEEGICYEALRSIPDPTSSPFRSPTTNPTALPTIDPTIEPTHYPTTQPTANPTIEPTQVPTTEPTSNPTIEPTQPPTKQPTTNPTVEPTQYPTTEPTSNPTTEPTQYPTKQPTSNPSMEPTQYPTNQPTSNPTIEPTIFRTAHPTCNKTPMYKTCCQKIADTIIQPKLCTVSTKTYYEFYLNLFQCNKTCQSFDHARASLSGAAVDCFKSWAEYTQLYLLCAKNQQLTDWSYYETNKDVCFACNEYKPQDPQCISNAPTAQHTYWPTIHPTNAPTYEPTMVPSANPTLEPTVNPVTTSPTTNVPTSAPTICESGSFYVKRNHYELAIIVDNSCGLTAQECKIQLQQIGDLLLTIKVDLPPHNITKVAYVEYGESGADVRVGLNDDLQLNAAEFYNFIINNGSCGGGGNGKTDLVSGIEQALDEFILNGNSGKAIMRKFYIINNCINNVQNTENEICDRLYHKLEARFKQQVDKVIINIPAPSDRAHNTIEASHEYLECFIRANKWGQETGGICAAADDGVITSNDYTDLYLDDECREEFICGFTGRMRPETDEPSMLPTKQPTFEPTSYPTVYPSVEPTLYPTLEPTLYPTLEPTLYPTLEPTIEPTTLPTYAPIVSPSVSPTAKWPTIQPTENGTDPCAPHKSKWSKWGNWSSCSLYKYANNDAHFNHVRYRKRECECVGSYGKGTTCEGDAIDIEECATECVAVWSPWCPWSVCIIQDFSCITEKPGMGICSGFKFRHRSCMREVPNNEDLCGANCTCEADEFGHDTHETDPCFTTDCLQIVFDDEGDDKCVPQWRLEHVEKDDNGLAIRDLIIQQGGALGEDCIEVEEGEDYWLIVTRGCGTIRWFYRGNMTGLYRYDGSIQSDYELKSLKISIPKISNIK